MNPFRPFLCISSVASVVCFLATLAQATMPSPSSRDLSSLKSMMSQADLVFTGQVEDITYALSDPSGPEGIRVPYTFVTYRVDKVFMGEAPGGSVTLRFIGGLDPRKGLYLATTNTPQFDVGDQDILFVQNNTKTICPLVNKVDGRLRIIGDRVYSEEGRSVLAIEKGLLRYGPRYKLPEVESTNVNGKVYTTLKSGPSALESPSEAMEAADMLDAIRTLAADSVPNQAFVNADPKAPFAEPDMSPVPMPDEKTD